MKVGFLLPKSTIYPLIGFDFIDGFKSYLAANALTEQVTIVSENIGFGLNEAEVYAKNEQLLLQEKVDVVIAFIDGRVTEMLEPLFTATGKLLIIVNMGAHYPYDATPSASILHHTFDIAFNSHLTGKLAAQQQHTQAVMATSYYDGGYLQCYAMNTGYLLNNGTITYNYISHFKKDLFELASLEQHLTSSPETKALLCLFSGDVSPQFYTGIATMQQSKDLYLYVSPMMLDACLKEKLPADFSIAHTQGYTSWDSTLANEENKNFMQQFGTFTKRAANLFGLLGWETGILLQAALPIVAAGENSSVVVTKLKQQTFRSPRGWLKIEASSNQTYSPSYLVQCKDNYALTVVHTLEDTLQDRQQFISEKPEGAASGWRNTYLCS
jgi:branched-chain amino acid transport system substrate-binding protein